MSPYVAAHEESMVLSCDDLRIAIETSWHASPEFAYERVRVRHARALAKPGGRWEVSGPWAAEDAVILPQRAVAVLERAAGRMVFEFAEAISHPLHIALMVGGTPVLYLFLDPPGYGYPPPHAKDVRFFGIEPDTGEVQTSAINAAIVRMSEGGGGTLVFPPGRYLTGTVLMRDRVLLHLDAGAVIAGSMDMADYPLDAMGTEFRDLPRSLRPGAMRRLILFDHVSHAGITGRGTIDGRGSEMRQLVRQPRAFMNLIRMVGCLDIRIEGVMLKDSEFWSTHLLHCKDVHFSGVKIFNEIPPAGWDVRSPVSVWNNADGINPDSSTRVRVQHSFFHTGDDCLPIKNTASYRGQLGDVSDISVKSCLMVTPVTAMKIGTETLGGKIERVLFEDIEVVSASRVFGADLKDGALADGITLRDIRVFRCNRPFDLWILHREDASRQERFSNLSNVLIERLHIGKAAIDPAGFECHIQGRDAQHKVRNVLLRDLVIDGKRILSQKDYPLILNEFVDNIRFERSPRTILPCVGDPIAVAGRWVTSPEAAGASTIVNADPLPAFYLVGDSISIDYHADLERLCCGQYRYSRKGGLELARSDLDHPQGANGGDSGAVLEHLREVLTEPTSLPQTLMVNCGLHDLKVDPATGMQQVSLEAYRRNLKEIAELVQQSGRRLLWITTTPVDENRHNARSKAFHRYERDMAAYNAAAVEIMTARNVTVIDLHAFTTGLVQPIFRDHVHFLPEVSRAQAEFLHSALNLLE